MRYFQIKSDIWIITHDDRQVAWLTFEYFPWDILIVSDMCDEWKTRTGAKEITKEEAQASIDLLQLRWMFNEIVTITLP